MGKVALSDVLKAVLEVSVFVSVFFVCAWYLQAVIGGGYGWYSKAVMILLGVVGVLLHRGDEGFRLAPRDLGFSLKWSGYTLLLFLLPSLLAVAFSGVLGVFRPQEPRTVLVDAVWYFVFVGLAEELFFRGYVQPRLNEVFTAKYKSILWVKFEWTQGTLVTGVFFFGIPHLLAAVNPFTCYVNFTPIVLMVVLSACFLGVVLGVIREKTEGILLPTVLHGAIDFSTFSVGRFTGLALSGAASAFALFLFFAAFFEKILTEE